MPIYGFGFGPRGPRRGGFGLWFFILLLFMGPGALVIPILGSLIPILIIGLGIFSIVKLISGAKTNSNRNTYTSKSTDSFRRNEKKYSSDLSNAQIVSIEKKLIRYFKENIGLPIINDISLVTQNGSFKGIDDLYIAYKNEKVVKLAEFKQEQPEMYHKIISLLLAFSKKNDDVMASKVQEKEVKKEDILSDAQKYIDKINALNAAIPQEEITNGLYQTCDLLNKIEISKSSKVDENKLDKLYDYYLPILTGILENYKSLQDNAIKGEEFKKCEAQLIKTIMLINEALKTLYAEMHEDDYLNINADINTLQTLLEKDGYGEDPFSTKGK